MRLVEQVVDVAKDEHVAVDIDDLLELRQRERMQLVEDV
jgi:hypothetical protein